MTLIKTHKYHSPVVVDFKMKEHDTESNHEFTSLMDCVRCESNLSAGLNIDFGDQREVLEGTSRSNTSDECIFPGCDGNDFIHDDLRLGNLFACEKIDSYGVTSAKFSRGDIQYLEDHDYLLFPTFVYGYVLNQRIWANLDMDILTNTPHTASMFDALHIPISHKESLNAILGIYGDCSSDHHGLDIVSGKGQGIVILLHGKPGLGKTATAEAMASDLNRPLYPITYADLGDAPSQIETNLKKIFRYAQRWNCVLLLDEADIFLMPRNIEDTRRNSIVSIFLRNLESYPGIFFLTTNHLERFDDGVLDRVHLKLGYPQLSQNFTENIFNDQFERINKRRTISAEPSETQLNAPESLCQVKMNDSKEIQAWQKQQFRTARAAGRSWWNGRQIRNAFQLATKFAKLEMHGNKKDVASIKLRHFERVLKFYDTFNDNLRDARRDVYDITDEESVDRPTYTATQSSFSHEASQTEDTRV